MFDKIYLKLLHSKVVNLNCKVVNFNCKVVNFNVSISKFNTFSLKSCKYKM
jgi:phage FluMu protein Com